MMMNNKAQMDEVNLLGIIGGVIGGFIGVFITAKMNGGLFLKFASFAITGIVCYVIASKLVDE